MVGVVYISPSFPNIPMFGEFYGGGWGNGRLFILHTRGIYINPTGTMDAEQKQKIKKRKYSRKGCNECKRRKIKCDEASPACYNCSRLNKLCRYLEAPKFHHEGTAWNTGVEPQPKDKLTLRFYDPSATTPGFTQKKPVPMVYMTPQLENVVLTPTDSILGSNIEMQSLFDEASELVHDINDMLGPDLNLDAPFIDQLAAVPGMARNGSNGSPQSVTSEASFKMEDFSNMINHSDMEAYVSPSGIRELLKLSNLELIDQCIVQNSLVDTHIRYLKTLTTTDLAYHLYPFASLIEGNEVVKLLLTYSSKCPYLLTSLLAILATFQFNQTGKVSHDTARQKYITVCLKLLGDAFTENSGFRNAESFSSHIEKLLLTVLVLTSYFTATTSLLIDNILNLWKAHLRGARDLLVNYSKIAKGAQSEFMSGGLALAKSWFFALESVAVMHLSLGGSLAKTKPADMVGVDLFTNVPDFPVDNDSSIFLETGCFEYLENPGYHDALRRLSMIYSSPTLSDFNLYWGFTSKMVNVLICYTQLMDALRLKQMDRAPLRWTTHLMGLASETAREQIIPLTLAKTYVIPTTSKGHPDHPQVTRLQFPDSCYVREIDDEGNPVCYSWFDATQQLHVDLIYLKLLVSQTFFALPRTHRFVQETVRKVFDGAFFIKSKDSPRYEQDKEQIVVESDHFYLSQPAFDNRCIMIQSVFRLCSTVVIDDLDFEKIELYFMGLVKLGNGSSLNALDLVVKFKESRRARKEQFPDEVDDEIYGDDARVSDIPFA